MTSLRIDTHYLEGFVSETDILSFEKEIFRHRDALHQKAGPGNDFLGWINLPEMMLEQELSGIQETAKALASRTNCLVVIGIGGSYLGARAVIEALQDPLLRRKEGFPELIYAGHHLSEDYLHSLLKYLETKEPGLIVISKSGTTTEPAIAFRLLRAYMEKRFGKSGARDRIVAITDRNKGALRSLADQEGYTSFVIEDDIGGRYSVLSPVGLLPIAAAGWDIRALLEGANQMAGQLSGATKLEDHPAGWYATARNALYRRGKPVEILVNYEPSLMYLSEWWKQLYGESEGKQQKGIFPAAVNFTTDLHSMGQYIQDGLRVLFESVISVSASQHKVLIPKEESNLDGLNYIAGMRLQEVNQKAGEGTLLAHYDGGVPAIRIQIPEIRENVLGELLYFYEMGCALSGYMLGVNPFDQPGVEDYKKNMFALLGKAGFEDLSARLQQRLGR